MLSTWFSCSGIKARNQALVLIKSSSLKSGDVFHCNIPGASIWPILTLNDNDDEYTVLPHSVPAPSLIRTVNCDKLINIIFNNCINSIKHKFICRQYWNHVGHHWLSLANLLTELLKYLAKLNSHKKEYKLPKTYYSYSLFMLFSVVDLQWTMYMGRNASPAETVMNQKHDNVCESKYKIQTNKNMMFFSSHYWCFLRQGLYLCCSSL